VIMSDCHRGDGSWADSFARNQNLFFAALTRYNEEKYTYIELGDGDELWENRRFSAIMDTHYNVFWLMSQFYRDGRLYFAYGNHDIAKRKKRFVRKNLTGFYDVREKQCVPLFPGINVYEGFLLKDEAGKTEVFLLHGHQADFFNDRLWRLSRFLVRYIWRPLEIVGVNDPMSASRSGRKKLLVEKKLIHWANKTGVITVAGHTHKPVLPEPGEPLYFNDGSCVHPRCITAIEIAGGAISLVKWSYKTREDGTVYVGREILAGPEKLSDYYGFKGAA